jgi:hypothetical protein
MDTAEFDQLQALSEALARNNTLVPVAVAVVRADPRAPITAASVSRALEGRCPANRVGQALTRIAEIGALVELPYTGPPNPKFFERADAHPFWTFISDWALVNVAGPAGNG